MKGLSYEIRDALDTTIEGLRLKYEVDELDGDKIKKTMDTKISSFKSAKKMLDRWVNSPNAPDKKTLQRYVENILDAGDEAIKTLRKALQVKIDFASLPSNKHDLAINAKPVILEAILDLDSSLTELRDKLATGDLTLGEVEFKLGYPERFAKGEFIKFDELWKTPLDKDGAVLICPYGTKGEKITLEGLDIILPEVPKNKKDILFSDLPKKEQYWRRPDIPNFSPEHEDAFGDFIKQEFRRRYEGVWFMNNGVPTYITGHHYFAMVYFRMMDDGDFMKFRYAQLNMFYHLQACIVDPRCLGQLFGKSRRTGFTYCVLAILLNWATSKKNAKYGMMSKTGEDSSEAFLKLSYGFQSLPFWMRPVVQGKIDSTSHLHFSVPADNSKSAKKAKIGNVNDYLNTMIDYRNTSNGAYDSIKLNGYLLDETFKFKRPINVITHLGMVAPTMMPNNGVPVGTMFAGSTMGAHKDGGAEGIELINGSYVKDRDPITGKTATGLYFYFLPAQENMEDFTDIYGYCHTEKPKTKTLNVKGAEITMGSIEFLMATEEQKRKQSDVAYNEQLRTYPRKVEHMMRDEASECVFNLNKLIEQMEYNDTLDEKLKYTVGNFDWKFEEDGDVVFNPNPNGRFKVSWLPSVVDGTQALANAVGDNHGQYYPLNKDCVRFGCDPFTLKSTHGEGSKGAIHGKTIMFPEGGAPSNQFVVEYIARPTDETIFFEDVIKVIRFYGAPILVESNRIDLLRHLRNRGYRKFAMNRLDKPENKLNPNELEYGGQPMSGKDIIDSHMNSIGQWIEHYVGVSKTSDIRTEGEMGDMVFSETLKDWSKFNPDARTKYDATISSGLAIMACQTEKYKGKKKERPVKKINFIKKFSNSGSIGSALK